MSAYADFENSRKRNSLFLQTRIMYVKLVGFPLQERLQETTNLKRKTIFFALYVFRRKIYTLNNPKGKTGQARFSL